MAIILDKRELPDPRAGGPAVWQHLVPTHVGHRADRRGRTVDNLDDRTLRRWVRARWCPRGGNALRSSDDLNQYLAEHHAYPNVGVRGTPLESETTGSPMMHGDPSCDEPPLTARVVHKSSTKIHAALIWSAMTPSNEFLGLAARQSGPDH